MKGLFKYDVNRCVSCLACVAACRLVNRGNVPWRMLLSDNPGGYPGLPVHNLSIACNHCEFPACLDSCPAKAYHVDSATGAVILDEDKCMGCNYCFWNCPFDAPHYDSKLKNVQKCHFCNERLIAGGQPSCTSACPTGALSFDYGEGGTDSFGLLIDSDLRPRISFKKPVSAERYGKQLPEVDRNILPGKVSLVSEWSLVVFTFLSSLLFAFSFSALTGGVHPETLAYTSLSLVSVFISLIHLGHPARAWRAVSNIKSSPLSAEILVFLLFIITSNFAIFTDSTLLHSLSFISGLLMLVAIDNVYTTPDNRLVLKFHPGQAFLAGLLLASFFAGEFRALFFIAVVKIILNGWVRFYRLYSVTNIITGTLYMILLVVGLVIFRINGITLPAVILVLSGELINRTAFYFDFNPPGITNTYIKRGIKDEKR